jgi:hypothetical protein
MHGGVRRKKIAGPSTDRDSGLLTLERSSSSPTGVAITGDSFAMALDGAPTSSGTVVLASACHTANATSLPAMQPGANATSLALKGGREKKMTKVTYICRRAKKKVVLLTLFYFYFYFYF